MTRQETGNYINERARSSGNPDWGEGSDGRAYDSEQTLHMFLLESFRGIPPAFPHHPVSCLPVSTHTGTQPRHPDKSHTSEAKGPDKQDRLLRQRGPQAVISDSRGGPEKEKNCNPV